MNWSLLPKNIRPFSYSSYPCDLSAEPVNRITVTLQWGIRLRQGFLNQKISVTWNNDVEIKRQQNEAMLLSICSFVYPSVHLSVHQWVTTLEPWPLFTKKTPSIGIPIIKFEAVVRLSQVYNRDQYPCKMVYFLVTRSPVFSVWFSFNVFAYSTIHCPYWWCQQAI